MKKFMFGCGALCLVGVVFLVIMGVVCLGYTNKEVGLRNQFQAQNKANEAIYDNVWKTISQQAEVTDNYKEGFKEVWKEIMAGNSSGERGAALSVFVNRINPKFDSKLYLKLMTTIEAQRKEFLNNQKKLVDIKREHDNLRGKQPSKLVLGIFGDTSELELKLVTSSKTEQTFETGKEDDVGVFNKKKPAEEKKEVAPKK